MAAAPSSQPADLAAEPSWLYDRFMTRKRFSQPPAIFLGGAVIASMIAGAASAGDAGEAANHPLPGVVGDYSIVKPADPTPEADDGINPARNGQFKIGDMDVRISGSITVDIVGGSIRPPRSR